jgi:4-oxalocrotonate tautomerase
MPFISVEILKGRTLDQRREFARRVTDAAVETLDTTPDKVRIVFRELDPTELSRGGILAIDVQRGPKPVA